MKQHVIYVIGRQEGPVKVGITSAIDSRLAAIQTGCHFEIDLFYYRACRDRDHALMHERNFHRDYAHKRLAGEWFDFGPDYAADGIDTAMDLEIWFEHEAKQEWMAAQLNIWQLDQDGAHPNH
jgi:predicted GIY-YIG superfamily endonuclease